MIVDDSIFDCWKHILFCIRVLQVTSSLMMTYRSISQQISFISNEFDLVVAINHFLQVECREFNIIVRQFESVDMLNFLSRDDWVDNFIDFLMQKFQLFDHFMQSEMFDIRDFNAAMRKLIVKTNSILYILNKQKDMRHRIHSICVFAKADSVLIFRFETRSRQKVNTKMKVNSWNDLVVQEK